MTEFLFVYGTLRKEMVHQVSPELRAIMEGLPYLGIGQIQGELYYLGSYPGAIVGNTFKTKIVGEIYELPEPNETLEILDVYEGFIPGELEASLYARSQETISLPDNRQLECWMYLYNDWVATGSLIETGDYIDFIQNHKAC